MQATHQARHVGEGKQGLSVALGWPVLEQNGSRIWHNGGTGGYRTDIGFDEVTRRGVVLMSNSHMVSDDIARRALNSAFPIIVPKPMAMQEQLRGQVHHFYTSSTLVGGMRPIPTSTHQSL